MKEFIENLDKFLKKGIDFKDDQTIIRNSIFNDNFYQHFN